MNRKEASKTEGFSCELKENCQNTENVVPHLLAFDDSGTIEDMLKRNECACDSRQIITQSFESRQDTKNPTKDYDSNNARDNKLRR